ncbi:MAG: phage integrase SAM-like domain-containing protein [Bacteroidales bacterium]|nr:phage integrase SAM-like domain-containing protein [Bacteroidales bacterium]
MENASAKIILRTDFERTDGTNPIYLRVTINRRTRKYSTKESVKEVNWDSDSYKVKRGDIKHLQKNLVLESCLKRANDIIFNHKISNTPLTFEVFEKAYLANPAKNSSSFIDFAINEIERDYKNKGSFETYRTRKCAIEKVKTFAKKDVEFSDLTYNFLKKLEAYMIGCNNCQSSRARVFRIVKTMLNRAIAQDLTSETPFSKFKFREKNGEREFLTAGEVKKLEELITQPQTDKTIKRALIPFLFSCYTGIRFRDIYNLRHKINSKWENNTDLYRNVKCN